MIFVQNPGFKMQKLATLIESGYVSNSGNKTVDALLTRGGISSMMGTVSLIIMTLALGGILMHLGIIDSGNAYYILKIESPATISVRSHEGKSLSLYRSGIGKCLLAWQPASVQASIIEDLQWERATPTTITDAQQLREELGRIRARGWSFDNGEDYPDVRCVAAPVFNANNDLTAAISVVGTRLQINEDNRDYLAGKAIACAKDISRLLGWKSPFEQLASS